MSRLLEQEEAVREEVHGMSTIQVLKFTVISHLLAIPKEILDEEPWKTFSPG